MRWGIRMTGTGTVLNNKGWRIQAGVNNILGKMRLLQ